MNKNDTGKHVACLEMSKIWKTFVRNPQATTRNT